MPKLAGPCFSLKAAKSLRKFITYQTKRGLDLVFKYKKPGSREPFSPSPSQQAQRTAIGVLVAAWRALGSEIKEAWDYRAKLVKYIGTGYHYFIHKGGVMGLLGDVRIIFGSFIARVTSQGWLEVKTHTPDKCFHQDFAGAQADADIITPTAGKKIRVIQVYVSTSDEATNVSLVFPDSAKTVFKLYTGKKQAQTGNVICGEGAVDEKLQLTCGAGTFVSVAYDEV